jgi:histidyl-tRNA synthetase
MELLPARQVQFDLMVARLRETFSLYGFTPLDTPLLESSEVLLAKGGGDTEKQIYRFTKGESDLSLRFDLTVPLAKYVAQNAGQLVFPFRRFQIGKVYRGERAQRGRFREFYQADIDIIGDGELGIGNDAEIPGIIYNAFNALGLRNFVIRVNNRKILTGYYEILGLSDKAQDVMRTVDKLDKIGADKVSALLTDELGVAPEAAAQVLALISHTGDPFDALEQYAGRNATFDLGVSELRAVTRDLAAFGVPEANFRVDLTIARGLDYYTGTVFETTLTAHPEIGSICSGGRYDDLAGYYTDRKLPGVGISIGLTRLFFVLEDCGYLNDAVLTAPADVLVVPMTDDTSHAVQLATALRKLGVRAQIYSENKKFKQKLAYADRLGIPFVALLGEDELAAGKVTIKDMRSGEQTTASAALLCEGIRDKLSGLKAAKPINDAKPIVD